MTHLPGLLLASAAILQLSVGVTAKLLSIDPSLLEHANHLSGYEIGDDGPVVLRADDLVALRIMPLGASIVGGVASDLDTIIDTYFYCEASEERCDRTSSIMGSIDMVGSKHDGTIEDESLKPKVVGINIGTDDAKRNDDIPYAKQQMKDVLTGIWKAEDMLDACVILSTLIPTPNAAHLKNNGILNDYSRQLVSELEGNHLEVDENPEMKSCNEKYDDGIYYHNSEYKGIIENRTTDHDKGQFFFAALYSREHDDLVGWYENDTAPYDNAFGVWKNMGGGKFVKIEDLHPDLHCVPQGSTFDDKNIEQPNPSPCALFQGISAQTNKKHGVDDLVCVDADGNAYLSINKGHGMDSKPPAFERVSNTAKIKDNVGFKQSRIRILILMEMDAAIALLSMMEATFKPGVMEGNITGVHMLDLNGDGRAEWLGSCKDGDGLKIDWRQCFDLGASSGYTHARVAQFNPKEDIRTRVMFGRIWGEPQDFGHFGLKDYAYLRHSEDMDGKHHFQMRAWKNIDHGGIKVKADSVKYCNMLGHNPPREDYAWIWSDGKLIMYPNICKNKNRAQKILWGPVVTVFDPENMSIGKKLDRRDLHLMDWDDHGDCDLARTNPDNVDKPRVDVQHIKFAQDKDRVNLRFADVIGDGFDDMLWVEFNGDGCLPGTTPIGPGDNGSGQESGVVYINTDEWSYHTALCEGPCVLVWPPSQLPGVSTFTIPAFTAGLEVRSTTTTTITLHPPPIVTDQVPMSNSPLHRVRFLPSSATVQHHIS
ncbi:killer toxin subunits alpha beta [Trichoderma arundinaceum]|uniref:Killer toxin subunits alpha beta n=1 Tax=Trichoderma arundinaceum TaxID=490622 RepID=A0A395ND72_TRIAR|nr:killer toxin subunits alpha beta [Trichoderma arundinaceum]